MSTSPVTPPIEHTVDPDNDAWHHFACGTLEAFAKVMSMPSHYGMLGGRVIKLEITDSASGELIYRYDRGHDVNKLNQSQAARALLLHIHNNYGQATVI
jgi:hypothetical protein